MSTPAYLALLRECYVAATYRWPDADDDWLLCEAAVMATRRLIRMHDRALVR